MSNFNDQGAGDEVKQGKYANALILFLMSALISVAGYFAYQASQRRVEFEQAQLRHEKAEAKRTEREDKIRDLYQTKLDERERYHESRYLLLQTKIDSIRDNIIAEMKMGRVKSEVLATQSKKTAQSVQAEVKKTTAAAKEFDSVSKSITQ
jgi:hypothetical protein